MWFETDTLTWQFLWSGVVVVAIRWMKRSNLKLFGYEVFGWIDQDTAQVNRWLGIVASGVVALGLHWHFSYTKDAAGTVTATLTGVDLASLAEHARDWAFSYMSQQTGHHISLIPELLKRMGGFEKTLADLRTLQKELAGGDGGGKVAA